MVERVSRALRLSRARTGIGRGHRDRIDQHRAQRPAARCQRRQHRHRLACAEQSAQREVRRLRDRRRRLAQLRHSLPGSTIWRSISRSVKPNILHFEKFGCENCHVPNTPMDMGRLIRPMVGVEKLQVDSIESCVMCHDNSRNGSRRLDDYLQFIHFNRANFAAAKTIAPSAV